METDHGTPPWRKPQSTIDHEAERRHPLDPRVRDKGGWGSLQMLTSRISSGRAPAYTPLLELANHRSCRRNQPTRSASGHILRHLTLRRPLAVTAGHHVSLVHQCGWGSLQSCGSHGSSTSCHWRPCGCDDRCMISTKHCCMVL